MAENGFNKDKLCPQWPKAIFLYRLSNLTWNTALTSTYTFWVVRHNLYEHLSANWTQVLVSDFQT